jgi:molybdopterin-guanine dinucleotide biosynthesis protein A
MGSDKAVLPWAGETLLQTVLNTARQACARVVICGSRQLYGDHGEVIEDAEPGLGPLSGIHAALQATQTDLNLILSVDLPLMPMEFLLWLLQQARSGEQKITVPESLGKLQPLCAVYHRDTIDAVDRALGKRDLKVARLFQRVATRIISEEEVRAAGFEPAIFTNVNTPEEYQSLLRKSSAHLQPERA